jgi:hypothetical protein
MQVCSALVSMFMTRKDDLEAESSNDDGGGEADAADESEEGSAADDDASFDFDAVEGEADVPTVDGPEVEPESELDVDAKASYVHTYVCIVAFMLCVSTHARSYVRT